MIYLRKFNESTDSLLFNEFKEAYIANETSDDLKSELDDCSNFEDLFNVISLWSRIPLEERINKFLDKFNYNSTREYSFTRDEINYELNKFLNKSKTVPKNDPEKLNHFHTQLKDLLVDLIEDKTISFIKMNSKISIEYHFNSPLFIRAVKEELTIDSFTEQLKNSYLKFNQFRNYINMFKESNPDAKFRYDNSFINTFSMNIFV